MKTLMCATAAVTVGLAIALPIRADDDAAKKVIADAVKALGGAAKLTQYKDKSLVQKGKMKIFMPIEAEGTFETTVSDGKFKRDFQFTFMNTDISNTAVFDGKTMWVFTKAGDNKNLMTFDKKEEIEALKEAIYAEKMAGLALLNDKNIKVAIIGDDKVGDTPVVGVRVSSEGHKDVSVYFDKKTHLVKKVIGRGLDFETQMEVEQERLVDEYKEIDGMMRPVRATILKDGKKLAEIEITEMKFIDKPSDDTFAKPKE